MLLKMKNLREELGKNTALRDTLVAGLGAMGPSPTPHPYPYPCP